MELSRDELLKTAEAIAAALPVAQLMELQVGRRARQAMAAALPIVHPGDVPDLVLLNATVRTLDARHSVVEAIAVKNGRILALGDTKTIRQQFPLIASQPLPLMSRI